MEKLPQFVLLNSYEKNNSKYLTENDEYRNETLLYKLPQDMVPAEIKLKFYFVILIQVR